MTAAFRPVFLAIIGAFFVLAVFWQGPPRPSSWPHEPVIYFTLPVMAPTVWTYEMREGENFGHWRILQPLEFKLAGSVFLHDIVVQKTAVEMPHVAYAEGWPAGNLVVTDIHVDSRGRE